MHFSQFVFFHGRLWTLLCGDELFCACVNVWVLLLAGPENVPQVLPRRADHTLPNRPDVRGYGSVLLCLVFHVLQQEIMSQRHVQPDSWRPDVCLVFVPVL